MSLSPIWNKDHAKKVRTGPSLEAVQYEVAKVSRKKIFELI